jgi:2-hydroxycyclohexanecarboxyl-CoA dehydrogenase
VATPAGGGVAVITGAGGGLGTATARALSAAGYAIACVDVNAVAAQAIADELVGSGGSAVAVGADLCSDDAIAALPATVHDALGPVSHLVNLAGMLNRTGLADTDASSWRQTMDLNVTAPFFLTKAFAADLRSAPYGRVINCASFAGTRGYEFTGYAASKAALINLTSSLMFDFWGTAVTINAVAPGAMNTPMLNRAAAELMAERTPTGRILDPEDVASVIAFLASPASKGLNGTTTVIDGGASLLFTYR